KHRPNGSDPEESPGRWARFLASDWSDYTAAFLAGIAIYSKPPNVAVLGPLVLFYILKKRVFKPIVILLVCALSLGIFAGYNILETGHWNYQGGERKAFNGRRGFPLEKSHLTFDTAGGTAMSTEGYTEQHLLPVKCVFYNIYYYFTGRYTGITWYFFPAVLFLMIFFIRKKQLYQWLLLIAIFGEILIWIIMMPDNYAGGGGGLANRYFLSIYPFFFFLPGLKRSPKELAACWVMAALFISPILINPFFHSHYPATHAKKAPYTWLPLEMTLNNNWPINTNTWAFRQSVRTSREDNWLTFLDDNFHPRFRELNEDGFWTRGPHKADMVLKTYYPIREIVIRLLNNPRRSNEITVKVGGEKKKITLGDKQWGTLRFTPDPLVIESWHLVRISIKASKGAFPYLEEEDSEERRYLGVYFEMDIIPEE
ncbi:hypothetical protein ACFLT9_13805, partial [Acidobacteriota bacterium]